MHRLTLILVAAFLFTRPVQAHTETAAASLAQEGFDHTEAFVQYRSTLASTDETGLGRANVGAWRFGPADREYRKAVSAFKESIRLDPERFDTSEALLHLFLYNRYHEELNPDIRDLPSADSLTLAIRVSFPREPRAWLYRGLVLYMQGDEAHSARVVVLK